MQSCRRTAGCKASCASNASDEYDSGKYRADYTQYQTCGLHTAYKALLLSVDSKDNSYDTQCKTEQSAVTEPSYYNGSDTAYKTACCSTLSGNLRRLLIRLLIGLLGLLLRLLIVVIVVHFVFLREYGLCYFILRCIMRLRQSPELREWQKRR